MIFVGLSYVLPVVPWASHPKIFLVPIPMAMLPIPMVFLWLLLWIFYGLPIVPSASRPKNSFWVPIGMAMVTNSYDFLMFVL